MRAGAPAFPAVDPNLSLKKLNWERSKAYGHKKQNTRIFSGCSTSLEMWRKLLLLDFGDFGLVFNLSLGGRRHGMHRRWRHGHLAA